jgi:ribonuclease-3
MSDVLLELPVIDRNKIEGIVGARIQDISLYQCAFTHKSALKQYNAKSSYETLEFLGDSVLGFVITKILYDRYHTDEHEGFLTKARTKLVRGKTLADISANLGLGEFVLMDDKGMRNQWYKNPKILEDVFEAFVGAMYLDLGVIQVKKFVSRVFDMSNFDDDNYKDIVMRWCQSNRYTLPDYRVNSYDKGIFNIDLYINGEYVSTGSAKTKKEAEQRAAEMLIRSTSTLSYNE